MKVLGVFTLISTLMMAQLLIIDLAVGMTFSEAASRLLNPFWVIEPGELIMLFLFISLTIVQQILFIRKNKNNKQNRSS